MAVLYLFFFWVCTLTKYIAAAMIIMKFFCSYVVLGVSWGSLASIALMAAILAGQFRKKAVIADLGRRISAGDTLSVADVMRETGEWSPDVRKKIGLDW